MINLLFETSLNSPLGELGLLADDTYLIELSLKGLKGLSLRGKSEKQRFQLEKEQLNQYFLKKRNYFTFKIHVGGTDFQQSVFESMKQIEYGRVLTYKQLASKIGKPRAYRAVGSACGANRLPIVIPCHRVVSSSGLGGFGGGIKRKRFLLDLESN